MAALDKIVDTLHSISWIHLSVTQIVVSSTVRWYLWLISISSNHCILKAQKNEYRKSESAFFREASLSGEGPESMFIALCSRTIGHGKYDQFAKWIMNYIQLQWNLWLKRPQESHENWLYEREVLR